MLRATPSARPPSTSTTATVAPSAASRRAVASPSPCPAPVTSATFPVNPPAITDLHSGIPDARPRPCAAPPVACGPRARRDAAAETFPCSAMQLGLLELLGQAVDLGGHDEIVLREAADGVRHELD